MGRKNAGDTVKAGFYWRMAQWQILVVAEDGGALPGNPGEGFYRIPALAMLALAPIMGALFVMFLPFIGIAIVLQHAIRAIGRTMRKTTADPEPTEQHR